MNLKMILQKLFGGNLAGAAGQRFLFYDVGFHGDHYLLALVDLIAQECQCFIETGTNVGSTLSYVARKYPHLQCLSCEPDPAAFDHAIKNTRSLTNAHLFNQTSQEFITLLGTQYQAAFSQPAFFWLDAHGYGFTWPLQAEVAFITNHFQSAYILVDDFRVPGAAVFGYDEYQGQICSFDFIKDFLNPRVAYQIHYPNYTERTSKHHSLRGWGLIEYGHRTTLALPESMRVKMQTSNYPVLSPQ